MTHQCDGKCDEAIGGVARAIVAAAAAAHPDDPAAADQDIQMMVNLIAPPEAGIGYRYPGTRRLPRTPAETEAVIAGVRLPYEEGN